MSAERSDDGCDGREVTRSRLAAAGGGANKCLGARMITKCAVHTPSLPRLQRPGFETPALCKKASSLQKSYPQNNPLNQLLLFVLHTQALQHTLHVFLQDLDMILKSFVVLLQRPVLLLQRSVLKLKVFVHGLQSVVVLP